MKISASEQRRAPVFAAPDAALPPIMSPEFGALLDAIIHTERQVAALHAERARLIDAARVMTLPQGSAASRARSGWSPETVARRELSSELAAALRIPERTAQRLVEESRALAHHLPQTRAALADGTISYRHAQTIIDHAWSLPEEAGLPFEAAILPAAERLPVARLNRKARDARERLHPESITSRHTTSRADREVSVQPARDGMAWLSAFLPVATAVGIDDRLDQIARSLRVEGEERTVAQLRADVFADLLVDGVVSSGCPAGCETLPPALEGATAAPSPSKAAHVSIGRGVRARVNVTVPVLTLLGLSEEPATLEGYGPIDPATARELAAHAPSFRRILTHPETGAVLSVGRDSYTVPADLRAWLQTRDETCRGPGCGRPAARCDLDHIVDWQHGGDTRHDNLAHECERDHNLKHHTRWTVTHVGGGVFEWTSPAGRKYRTDPALEIAA